MKCEAEVHMVKLDCTASSLDKLQQHCYSLHSHFVSGGEALSVADLSGMAFSGLICSHCVLTRLNTTAYQVVQCWVYKGQMLYVHYSLRLAPLSSIGRSFPTVSLFLACYNLVLEQLPR